MKTNHIVIISVVSAVVMVVILFVGLTITSQNGAIHRTAAIDTAENNINTEEARRVGLFANLVDAIESYNSHETKIMDAVTEARKEANKGNIEEAKAVVNAVAENYPELKSQTNYQTAMKEFSVTENRVAAAIKSYNSQVNDYNAYCNVQPRKMFLSMSGYTPIKYEPKQVPVKQDSHLNLFK